jgi:WD repeat and SOF domain-containing protein 1
LLPPRALFSDVARFLILHKFGGIYIDVDTLLLRDLQPLFAHEFAYRWSILDAFNTGILRLFAQSNVSSIIINRARQSKSPYEFFPSSIHKYSLPGSFYRLPSALFDPIWLAVDDGDKSTKEKWKLSSGFLQGFKDPSRQKSEISRRGRTVFDGAFTFHWHSSSTPKMYEHGSYLHQWSEFLNTQIYET